MYEIDFWASIHQGLTRTHNEDRYLWLTPEDTDGNGHLWIVCDGMGGEAGGARASHVVLERFREVYAPTLQRTGSPHEALTETLHAANRRLLYLASEDSALAGMGSTVAAVALYRDRLWVASVGDSRVYGWTPNGLLQWTVDHSKYEKMREHGVLSLEDERPDHPARHVLMNVVGREAMFVDTLNDRHFVPEDCALLICSDGLSGSVRPEELRVAFASLDARDAARFLLSAALPRSDDNITLQVVRFTPPITPRSIVDVAAAFGIELIDAETERDLNESGKRIKDARPSVVLDAPVPTERAKSTSVSMPITTKQGETVLLSPDALSNVFGDAPPSDTSDTVDEVSKRVAAAGGTMMLSPDELSEALEAEGVTTEKGTMMLSPDELSEAMKAHGVTTEKGTMMLSPDELSEAMEAHGIAAPESSASPADDSPPLDDNVHPVGKFSSSPIGVLDDPSATAAPEGDQGAPPSTLTGRAARVEARRRLAAQTGPDDEDPIVAQTALKHRWLYTLIAISLLLIFIVGVLLWKPDTSATDASSESEPSESAQDGLALKDRPEDLPPRQLPEYAFAEQVSAPDVVHEIDEMPAFAVLDGALLIDAHEATIGQFARIRDALSESGGDYASLQTVQCLGNDDEYTKDAERQPACVTPLAAAVYCDAVDRRLPRADEWNAIVEVEQARIARGYGKLFTRAVDGPPPSVPERVDSILGVYDGLPEFLYANEAQVRHGDLVLLAPEGDHLTRHEASGMERYESVDTPSDQMLGVRCITKNTEQAPVEPPVPTQARPAPRERAPAPPEPAPPEDATVGRVAPRMDAPDEAPVDPNIPDRSRIIEYMKEK